MVMTMISSSPDTVTIPARLPFFCDIGSLDTLPPRPFVGISVAEVRYRNPFQ